MEPRPTPKPTRPGSENTPASAERATWGNPPAAAPAPPTYPTSNIPSSYGGAATAPLGGPTAGGSPAYVAPAPPAAPYTTAAQPAATGQPWYDPNGPQPPVAGGYTPGRTLNPIDGGGSRLIGPILALILLAVVVGGAAWGFGQLFGGDDGDDNNNAAALNQTSVAAASVGSPTPTGAVTPETTSAGDEPTPTVSPGEEGATEEPEATTAPESEAEPTATKSSSSPASARSMLPASDDMPEGFQRTEDDKRTRDDVASSFADPEEALANLEDWDWRENAYRTFERTGSSDPNETTYINISIHRFGEKTGTAKATQYFADAVISGQGLEVIEVEPIGDDTIALKGAPEGVNLVVLYIREGNYLIRIGGSSPEGDPTADVLAAAELLFD